MLDRSLCIDFENSVNGITLFPMFMHLVFFILHIVAALFGFILLFVTIPLHFVCSLLLERNERERVRDMNELELKQYKYDKATGKILIVLVLFFLTMHYGTG